jgi:uncharacterized protein
MEVDGLAVTYTPAGNVAVVAVHGAGDGTRDSSPLYRQLHERLPPLGVGVATFDRRGEGDSAGEATRGRFDAQVRDALTVARSLRVRRVGLWGYSQGGWVAPLAATRCDAVAFVVTVGAPDVPPREQMLYANRRALEQAGYEPAPALALRVAFEEWVRGRGPAPDLAAAAREPWFPLLYLPARLLDTRERAWWLAEMDYDPGPVLAAVRVPMLHLWGERDSTTPRPADAVVIPDAEHDMTLSDGSLSPEYERRLVDFVRRHSK